MPAYARQHDIQYAGKAHNGASSTVLLSIDWYMNANINSAGAGLRLLNARSVLG